jgi:hypothetical protein
MAWVGGLFSAIPLPLYDRALARAKRKPRG